MDVAVTPAIAKTAGAAVTKVLGGFVPGAIREARRKRAVRRSVEELAQRSRGEPVLEGLSPVEVSRLVRYARLPDFEQVAIQLTGLVLQGRQSGEELTDLRGGLARSLWLHGVATDSTADAIAQALFDELWTAVVQAVGALGPSTPNTAPGVTAAVSLRAAAATRNCRLLERLRSLDDVHAFTIAIRSQISKVEGMVRPPHVESGRRVPLAHLYVEPHLVRHTNDMAAESAEHLLPTDVLAGYLRTVILGDPGGGKSTLAARLACHVAGSRHRDGDAKVPFLVVMREFAQRFEREQLSIARYLHVMVGARYQIEPTDDCVEFLLLNGRAVVIFDGLDELLDTSLRRRVTEAVEAFAHACPTATLLVTSRRVGYEQAPLDPALFTALRLIDFDDDQVSAYATKWFGLDRELSPDDRVQLTRSFLDEGQYVADLRRNPLMLALMCALYRGERYIPRNRLDVYERCAVLLFERWDRQRGIRVPLPFEQHVRPALWALALWMFTNNDTATERELVTAVRRFLLQKRFEDLDEADAAARAFVDYCRGRAWVLTDVGTTGDGEPLFAFTHRTFLEFFAANQLARTNPSAAALWEVLAPRIRAEEWDVVSQLAVLLLDRNVDGGADDFLELLVQGSETAPLDAVTPLLTFAARLFQYFVPTPQVLRRVFDACWTAASSVDDDAPYEYNRPDRRLSSTAWLLVATDELRAPIASLIRAEASAETRIGIGPLLTVRLDQLVLRTFAANHSPSRQCREFWHQESVSNLALIRSYLHNAAKDHVWAAVEATFSGDWTITDLVGFHGARTVCEAGPTWHNYRRAPILQQEILASHTIPGLTGMWIGEGAGTRAGELAAALPRSATPWARLSRVPWWDMDVEDPVNSVEPGTSAFEVMVMGACLLWEARALMRAVSEDDVSPGPLPSWLTLPPEHPVQVVANRAAGKRYHGVEPLEPIPAHWLSAPVRHLVERWASGEVDLVINDLS
ncbi:NACHT domain-containing protein [Lentzea tibetensis]|uniref:NACHT domain-containing protein n=1 Tax=Lentzea tibetensis TaxID=2591470 RepID=A0A563EWR6_9PSEU|nr:NACHT domain-containing protein [Lentzea tibetensis]TWP52012.1 NACHT domain-containing protein [Lentzea tibetensis]